MPGFHRAPVADQHPLQINFLFPFPAQISVQMKQHCVSSPQRLLTDTAIDMISACINHAPCVKGKHCGTQKISQVLVTLKTKRTNRQRKISGIFIKGK